MLVEGSLWTPATPCPPLTVIVCGEVCTPSWVPVLAPPVVAAVAPPVVVVVTTGLVMGACVPVFATTVSVSRSRAPPVVWALPPDVPVVVVVDVPVDADQVIGLNPRLNNLTTKTYL